jgi:hypothetical protein
MPRPGQVVLFRLALRAAYRAHLTHPQLSQQPIDLPAEVIRQVWTRVPCATAATSISSRASRRPSFTCAALGMLNKKSPRT